MSNAFRVDSDQLRSAAASVEGCCRQIESARKSGATEGVSSGMAGFAVAGACKSVDKASGEAFSGIAKSWKAWSEAAAGGAARYEQLDASNESLIRRAASAVSDLVV